MGATTSRLLLNYRQQELAYAAVLELARQGLSGLREGCPLASLQEINERKRQLLQRLADLEAGAQRQRAAWQRDAQPGRAGIEVEAVLGRITALIEQILRQEQEIELWLRHGADLRQESAGGN